MLFSRAAHSVLCGGRRQRVVLSALAGDPPQSQHLPAEQSPKTGGELRTDREGLQSEKLTCLCSISSWCRDYLLFCRLVLPSDISLWNAVCLASERWFFIYLMHKVSYKTFFWSDRNQTGHELKASCVTNGDSVITPGNVKKSPNLRVYVREIQGFTSR